MPLTVIPEGDIAEISDKREEEIAKEKKKAHKERKKARKQKKKDDQKQECRKHSAYAVNKNETNR